jgi:branched-chain amino acid transport system permease protein
MTSPASLSSGRRGRIAGAVALGLLLLALLVLPRFLAERPFELRLMVVIFLYAILGHGWNILGGYAGQSSIGHGVFFGLGAYTSTLLALRFDVSPWAGMFAGGLVAAASGVLIGIPCFRLRGHYFVIATLVVAESVFQLFTAWDWAGAAMGLDLPVRQEGLADFQFHRDKTPYYYIALALLVAVTALVWALQRARFGFVLQAIRDDEEAVQSLGFSPRRYKLVAMALSAGIVGVGGVFYAQYVLFIDPFSVLALSLSVVIALIPILGGAGTVAGPIVGAAVLVPISEYSRVYFSGSGRNVDLLIYGFLIMLIAVYRPDGVIGMLGSSWARRAVRRLGLARGAEARSAAK